MCFLSGFSTQLRCLFVLWTHRSAMSSKQAVNRILYKTTTRQTICFSNAVATILPLLPACLIRHERCHIQVVLVGKVLGKGQKLVRHPPLHKVLNLDGFRASKVLFEGCLLQSFLFFDKVHAAGVTSRTVVLEQSCATAYICCGGSRKIIGGSHCGC